MYCEKPRTRLIALPPRLRFAALLAMLCAVAGCGGSHVHRTAHYSPTRYYPPPGPPGDPWGPYVREASGRFGVPELWIRRVMRQESGGQEDAISWAGAMGLMQVMPDTYEELRGRYGLGGDPFDPHNNILAGVAYLREMYDRFGAPGFLAAYNAGPQRLDQYLRSGTPLPDETVNYVAAIAPLLGPGTPMSGPLAIYGGPALSVRQFAARDTGGGCDPDAAYNPDGPCTPRRTAFPTQAVSPAVSATASATIGPTVSPVFSPTVGPVSPVVSQVAAIGPASCDPDAAYDPTRPCPPAPQMPTPAPVLAEAERAPIQATQVTQPEPRRASPVLRVTAAVPPAPLVRPVPQREYEGRWGIQVGAFASLSNAAAAADTARVAAPDILRTARIELPPTTPFGGKVAYRARLTGLSPTGAALACAHLSERGLPCLTVPPPQESF